MALNPSRMDQEDLSALADIVPGVLWRTSPGSNLHTWADNLMRRVIDAQEARERRGAAPPPER